MTLQKLRIKNGPRPLKRKIEDLGDYASIVKTYVGALRGVDIQPEFIIQHADLFRSLIFKYMDGVFIERTEWEVMNGKIESLTKQVEELTKESTKTKPSDTVDEFPSGNGGGNDKND